MSLYIFSVGVLSLIFMLVLGSWWEVSAPFRVHASLLIAIVGGVLSFTVMLLVWPILISSKATARKNTALQPSSWGTDISKSLSTPAAVLEGHTLLFANRAFLAALGMAGKDELITGSPLSNLIHPGDHHNLTKYIASTVQNREFNATLRLRMLCADGTTLPVQVSLSPLRPEEPTGLALLQFSPPDREGVATATHDQDAGYRFLIDQIEQIVFQINADGELIFLNPSWEHTLDHTAQSSMQQQLIAFLHPEDRPIVESKLRSITQGRKSHLQLECRVISRSGNYLWMELRAKATSRIKGERSGAIGTLTDISRMKAIEASLRANRRSLSNLLSNVPGMLYRCKNDKNWSFEFVSDGCIDITGYEPYEMVGNDDFTFLMIIHPDDRVRAWEAVQAQVERQQNFQLIYRIQTRNGKIKWVWEQGKGVYSSAGELLALEGFITEIAEHADLDSMLRFQVMFDRHNSTGTQTEA